jgi:hypothetical protein
MHTSAVPEPRAPLLTAVQEFVVAAHALPGVERIALIGSLTTSKPIPKDADLLVTIARGIDLGPLARVGRRLQGRAQSLNLGADIFLCDERGKYLGRLCPYRECRPRARCRALHCGLIDHLNDDLQLVTLPVDLIRSPPLVLCPKLIATGPLPGDVETLLLARLR